MKYKYDIGDFVYDVAEKSYGFIIEKGKMQEPLRNVYKVYHITNTISTYDYINPDKEWLMEIYVRRI